MIEYMCFKEEADAEMAVVYFNSVLKPLFETKIKFYEDLSFRFNELDDKEWTTYKEINDLKWRRNLIREVYLARWKKERLVDELSYLEEECNELYKLTTKFESDFYKKTYEERLYSIIYLKDKLELVSEELLKKEKLLEQMEVV